MAQPVTFYPRKAKKFHDVFQLSQATIVVTTACNLSCSYCFEEHVTKVIKPDQMIKLIDVLVENNVKHYGEDATLSLSMFGGEPLLAWKSILAMYEHAKDKGYKLSTGITTNLTLLNDEMIEFFDEEQIGLLISIDGVREVHNRNRDNSYDTVAANVQRLIDNGCGHLMEARMTVLPGDFDRMVEGVQSLYALGFDNIACVPVTDQTWTAEQEVLFKVEADRLFDWVLERYNEEGNKRNLGVTMVDQNLYVNTAADADLELIPCTMGGVRWIAIDPTGAMYPCHQIPTRHELKEQLYLGNIFTDDIHEQNLLGEVQPGSWWKTKGEYKCSECRARVTCRGSCPAENLAETGFIGEPTDAWCQQTRALYDITKKYQESILGSSNIRNHNINKLKANLDLKQQIEAIMTADPSDPHYVARILKIYGVLAGNEGLVMEAFRNYFLKTVDALMSELQRQQQALQNQESEVKHG